MGQVTRTRKPGSLTSKRTAPGDDPGALLFTAHCSVYFAGDVDEAARFDQPSALAMARQLVLAAVKASKMPPCTHAAAQPNIPPSTSAIHIAISFTVMAGTP